MIGEGQRLLGASPGVFVLVTFLGFLALVVLAAPLVSLAALEVELPLLLEVPISVLGTALEQLTLGVGSLWLSALGLRALRGQEVDAGLGLREALPAVAPALVAGLILETLSQLGLVFCLVPGVIIYCTLAFAPLFVLDKGLGPFAALQASARVTSGSRWSVFFLCLLQGLVLLLGALALGIGLLAAIPIVVLAWAAAYERLWPAAGPARSVVPGRGWLGQPSPPAPDAPCPSCKRPLEGERCTCVGCGARYHASCRGSYCLQPACAQGWPVHPDWTQEERASGPWIEVPARPVPAGFLWVSLSAVLLTGVVSDGDSLRGVLAVLFAALPERWMGVSASVALVLVPWAALLLLAWHQHRSYRCALVDRRGLLLDWGPRWPGRRATWGDMRGFELDEDGVWIRLRGRLRPAVLLALPEHERGRLTELLEGKLVRRLDA